MTIASVTRTLWFLILFSVGSCNAQDKASSGELSQPDVSKSYLIDSQGGSIAGVSAGMTEVELQEVGFPYQISFENHEGDEYKIYNLTLSENIYLKCTLDLDNIVGEIESSSVNIRDQYGRGVGSTLGELKNSYPEGRFVFGLAEDYYASFVTGTRLVFRFEPTDLGESCLNDDEQCSFGNDIAVKAISVGRYSPN